MSTMTTEAIRKTVLVDFAPAEAFDLFTTRVSSWWPTETHSYAHDKVTDVIFEPRIGGLLYEVTDEGTAEWARITAWEPPHRLAMEWLIGKVSGTEVEVRFSPEGPGSRVELEHRGWERVPDATVEYQGYSHGWDAAATSSGSRPGANSSSVATSSCCVHQRIPVTYSDASCSTVNTGFGSKPGVRSR